MPGLNITDMAYDTINTIMDYLSFMQLAHSARWCKWFMNYTQQSDYARGRIQFHKESLSNFEYLQTKIIDNNTKYIDDPKLRNSILKSEPVTNSQFYNGFKRSLTERRASECTLYYKRAQESFQRWLVIYDCDEPKGEWLAEASRIFALSIRCGYSKFGLMYIGIQEKWDLYYLHIFTHALIANDDYTQEQLFEKILWRYEKHRHVPLRGCDSYRDLLCNMVEQAAYCGQLSLIEKIIKKLWSEQSYKVFKEYALEIHALYGALHADNVKGFRYIRECLFGSKFLLPGAVTQMMERAASFNSYGVLKHILGYCPVTSRMLIYASKCAATKDSLESLSLLMEHDLLRMLQANPDDADKEMSSLLDACITTHSGRCLDYLLPLCSEEVRRGVVYDRLSFEYRQDILLFLLSKGTLARDILKMAIDSRNIQNIEKVCKNIFDVELLVRNAELLKELPDELKEMAEKIYNTHLDSLIIANENQPPSKRQRVN